MVRYRCAPPLAFSPGTGCVAPPLRVYIQIYFQAGKLQMKSRSPKFPWPQTIHQLIAKKLQREMEICNRK